MDLFYESDMFKTNVEAEEVVLKSYDSIKDLRKSWNQPFFVLDRDEDDRQIPVRSLYITCIKHVYSKSHGRLLFVGSNHGSIEIWSLNSLKRIINRGNSSKIRIPVFGFSIINDNNLSGSRSLIVTYSQLDNTRSSLIAGSKSQAEMELFEIVFEDSNMIDDDDDLIKSITLKSTGYKKIFRDSSISEKKKASRLLHSEMLFSQNNEEEKCIFIWGCLRSSKKIDIHVDLLHLGWIGQLSNASQEEESWYTKFEVPSFQGNFVTALFLNQSVDQFFTNYNDKLDENLYKNIKSNNNNSTIKKRIYSTSFEFMAGTKSSITTISYLGEPQQVLRNISDNIRELTSQSKLKQELQKCIDVGLIQSITENESLFDLFDILLHQNMLCILCKHISTASRVEPISEWILRKCSILLKLIKIIHQQEPLEPFMIQNSIYVSSITTVLSNLSIMIQSLLQENNRFNAKDQKFIQLQDALSKLEIESQYLELWSWFNQHNLLIVKPKKSDIIDEPIISLLCNAANIDERYLSKSPWKLLNHAWENYNDPSDTLILISKLKVIYYYLLSLCIIKVTSYSESIVSFSRTFSQILSPLHQKQVKGFWLLDRHENEVYSVRANAAKYLGFDYKAVNITDMAYSFLTGPGVPIDWSGRLFRQFYKLNYEYAERFIQRDDLVFSKKDHQLILTLILPKNLYLSIRFIRYKCKITLEYDQEHFTMLFNQVFNYCLENDKVESLFLLSFTRDEEELLLKFLEKNSHKTDKRVLYYLQRSQFIKAIKTSNESNSREDYSHLVNNYKSVLPPIMIQNTKKSIMMNSSSSKDDYPMIKSSSSKMEIDTSSIKSSPVRQYSYLKTPKTEKVSSKFLQTKTPFQAPTAEQQIINSKRRQPFTPHIIPNTPASKIRMVHGTKSFAPFQRSSTRKTPRVSSSQSSSNPKAIPLNLTE